MSSSRRWPTPCTSDCAEVNGCTNTVRECEVCGREFLNCELIDGRCPDCADIPDDEDEEDE